MMMEGWGMPPACDHGEAARMEFGVHTQMTSGCDLPPSGLTMCLWSAASHAIDGYDIDLACDEIAVVAAAASVTEVTPILRAHLSNQPCVAMGVGRYES